MSTPAGLLPRPTRPSVAAPGGWPIIGHAGALLRDPLGFLEKAYQLADVVTLRLGPRPALLVNAPALFHRILVADAARYDKGFQFDQLRTLIGDGVGTSGGAKHRRQRRLMRPAFDHRHVAGYVETMARCAAQSADSWRGAAWIDAAHEMRMLSMAAAGRAMFDAEDADDAAVAGSGAVREILAALPVLLGGVGRRALLPLPAVDRIPTPANRRFDRASAALHALADRMVADARARQAAGSGLASGGGAPSLLGMLLAAVDEEDGGGMTDAQAHDEIMTVLLAGTETTGGTLGWVLHELSRDAGLQSAVRQEVDAVLGGRAPTAADLGGLHVTRRVISEALRCYPAGWILGRRPLADVELAGGTVPAGTQVLLNFYGLHHDPAAFPSPGRFDPRRWVDPGPEVLREHYLPFGLGARGCIGEGFAWSLMLTTVAIVVSRYTFRPVPGSVVKPVARTTLHPSAVRLLMQPR